MLLNTLNLIKAEVLTRLDDPHMCPVILHMRPDYLYERADKCKNYASLKKVMDMAFSVEEQVEILEHILENAKGLYSKEPKQRVSKKTGQLADVQQGTMKSNTNPTQQLPRQT